jgi:hypothetical protein
MEGPPGPATTRTQTKELGFDRLTLQGLPEDDLLLDWEPVKSGLFLLGTSSGVYRLEDGQVESLIDDEALVRIIRAERHLYVLTTTRERQVVRSRVVEADGSLSSPIEIPGKRVIAVRASKGVILVDAEAANGDRQAYVLSEDRVLRSFPLIACE